MTELAIMSDYTLPPQPAPADRDERLYLAPYLDHLARSDPAAFEKVRPAVEIAMREGRVRDVFTPTDVEVETARVLATGAPTLREDEIERMPFLERQQRAGEIAAALAARTFTPARFGSRLNDRNWPLAQLQAEEDGPPPPPKPIHYEVDLSRLSLDERRAIYAKAERGEAEIVPSSDRRRTYLERIVQVKAEHEKATADWQRLTGTSPSANPKPQAVESLSITELATLLEG